MDLLLIEEVSKYPILFNTQDAEFKNARKKDQTWNEVANRIGLDESLCKKKWKLLRDGYKRCKRHQKIRNGGNGCTGSAGKKQWKYFESMRFLDDYAYEKEKIPTEFQTDDEVSEEESQLADEDLESAGQAASFTADNQEPQKKIKLEDVLELASYNIQETTSTFVNTRKQQQNATALHFASLAQRISEANLPANVTMQIELEVATLVFQELAKFNN